MATLIPIKFRSGEAPRSEKTMKVLVVGATGLVGSEAVKALLQRGAVVRAFTRKQPKPGRGSKMGTSRSATAKEE